MRTSESIGRFVLLAAHAVYLAAPIAHSLLHEGPIHCESCSAELAKGPYLSADCGEDCNDPAHHHHHGHAGHDCTICKVHRTDYPSNRDTSIVGTPPAEQPFDLPTIPNSGGRFTGDPNGIRAPPTFRIS